MKKVIAMIPVLLGLILLAGCSSQQPVDQSLPVAVPIQPISVVEPAKIPIEEPAVQRTLSPQHSNVYVNTEFGFQITFPKSWSNKYKAVSSFEGRAISFLLPTSDKDWQNTEKDFPGYAEIFGVGVLKLADWNQSVSNCKKTAPEVIKNHGYGWATLPESCEAGVVGKTSEYVVTWSHPQDQPSDFVQYNVGGIDYLKQNFKALK